MWTGTARSVYRLATSLMDWSYKPAAGWGVPAPFRPILRPPSFLYIGYRVLPGVKVAGACCSPPTHI